MKRLFYGLLGSALFFAATGQARSDAIYWTDLLGDRTPHAVAVGDFNRDGIPDLAVRITAAATSACSWVAVSPDGEWITSASLDETVRVWKTPPLP
jgi:WD40 repeat protein